MTDDKDVYKVRPAAKGANTGPKILSEAIKKTPLLSSPLKRARSPSPDPSSSQTPQTPDPLLTHDSSISTEDMFRNLSAGAIAILESPYRSYDVPRPDYVQIANEVLQAGHVMLDSRSRRRKYRCRFHREGTPVCDMRTKLLVAPDMMRHMGIHADQERILVDQGRLDSREATLLAIFRRNPGLYETIDPKYCTCHACDPPEVFQRRDSYERHFKSRHDGTAQQLREIAAAIRGMERHRRRYRVEELLNP